MKGGYCGPCSNAYRKARRLHEAGKMYCETCKRYHFEHQDPREITDEEVLFFLLKLQKKTQSLSKPG